jgi:TetR/AcrR family transcriptional repressor of nem operon
MRITKERAAENRDKVVAAAAKLFRERGLEGVGIDAVAGEAGLTHGAIYSHFKSKDELAAAAIAHAMERSMGEWLGLIDGLETSAAFERLLRAYVSRAHRNAPEAGCAIATLGGAAPRASDELRDVFRGGVTQLIEILTAVSDGATAADRRSTAIARAAAMMGAVVMSRATMSDPALSDEILAVVRRKLTTADSLI